MTSKASAQWLFGRGLDLLGLLAPVWLAWIILFCLPNAESTEVPEWVWVFLVLGVDVGHVWSSLFRSYGSKSEFRQHRTRFIVTPIALLAIALGLLWMSELWFWRIMAYLAVFHFIRQQYGFTALYRIRESKRKDTVSIGKILWVMTTAFNWFGGIVWFNSDLIFTVSNVVAHGIPYLVLIWFYRREKARIDQQPNFRPLVWVAQLVFTILLLATFEEWFWDMLVWQDHSVFFQAIAPFPWVPPETKPLSSALPVDAPENDALMVMFGLIE